MRHVDFSPLYRSTVGFDRLFTMLDSLGQPENAQTYPPYNIERTGEDAYRISMAVAGFSDSDIAIEAHRNVLSVKGERKDEANGEGTEVLYRGIAARTFERRFQLADHVEVKLVEVAPLAGAMRFEMLTEPKPMPGSKKSFHKSKGRSSTRTRASQPRGRKRR